MPCGDFMNSHHYHYDEEYEYEHIDEPIGTNHDMPEVMMVKMKLGIAFVTERAVLFKINEDEGVWVPKSLIRFVKYKKKSKKVVVMLPDWFTLKAVPLIKEPEVESINIEAVPNVKDQLENIKDPNRWQDGILKVPRKEHKI